MTVTSTDTVGTRRRMLDTAVALFVRYSFAGTSLQMIADELGLTKAAIYYHFRTRDELLVALMEPILQQIRGVVEVAERRRGARARAESMLSGYVEVTAGNRLLAAVTAFDPGVRSALRNHPQWRDLIDRQLTLLAGGQSGAAGIINATAVLTGLAGAASAAPKDVDDDTLRRQLFGIGRRALDLPTR